jgi:hypothetical protein
MHLRSLALFIIATSAVVAAAPGRAPAPADAPRTYCNPLPIPDYGETTAADAALLDTRHPARPAPAGGRRWAELMRRSYGLDMLACPRCGGRLWLVALTNDRVVIAHPPTPRPSRRSPGDAARAPATLVDGDLTP